MAITVATRLCRDERLHHGSSCFGFGADDEKHLAADISGLVALRHEFTATDDMLMIDVMYNKVICMSNLSEANFKQTSLEAWLG